MHFTLEQVEMCVYINVIQERDTKDQTMNSMLTGNYVA